MKHFTFNEFVIYIFLLLLIVFRVTTTKNNYNDGDRIRITSKVLVDPINYETSQYIRLADLRIYLPLFPEIAYGDNVVVEGSVDGNRLKDPKLVSVTESKTFTDVARRKIISFYEKTLPDPYPGLIAGITLGSKGSLTNEFWKKVKATGVAHVVVASGTNITFVISFMVSFLSSFTSRRKMILLVILSILLYLFISGFEAPLVRAAIMGSLTFIAQKFGRVVSAWRVLLISALTMLVLKPNWLFDLGFILSFVATASLLLFEAKVRSYLKLVPELLKEGLSTSLAAQIGVAPILFVTFGGFNILSPIINALILWTIPFIMIAGAVGGVVGLIVPFLGKLVLYLSYPFLWWFTTIVTLFSS